MKPMLCSLACLLALSALGETATARAEFRLTKPTAWIVEDEQGGPQKAGPCGPESASEAMLTRQVTEVNAGATLDVEFSETTHHAGWFRISLAQNRSEFEGIDFSGAGCSYDLSTVPTQAHGNVLADGVGKTDTTGPIRTFKEKITIPDQPCERCTLQVVQVLADASREPSECIYYHCADIKIVAAGGGSASTAGGAGMNGGASTRKPVSVGSTGGMGGEMAVAGVGGAGGAPSSDGLLAQAKKLSGAAGMQSKSDTGMKMMSASSSGTGGKLAAKSGSSMSPDAGDASDKAEEEAEREAEGEGEDAMPKRAREAEDGGCAVVRLGSRASLGSAVIVGLASILFGARSRRSRAGSRRGRAAGSARAHGSAATR